jgi:beta-1,2-mannobiose phosphorylase / 1,2-beta-oligomannan phosphorylase
MTMLPRLFQRLLLGPCNVPPSRDDFEVIGTFNPGAALCGDEVILLVRVAERPRARRSGHTGLPRWTAGDGLVVDWVPDDELEPIDPRVVRRKSDGLIRLTFVSHLRVVRCGDGRAVTTMSGPVFMPQTDLEEFGVEDPRITPLNGRFFFTYVAVSRHGAATALASTADFQSFERHGIIFCPENKDVVLFPEKIGEDYMALHRPSGAAAFSRPEMWLARSTDLMHWGRHKFLWGGLQAWESGRIGAGTPPLRTPGGWLAIYHGCQRHRFGEVGVYSAGAMLLDLEQPHRILRRTEQAFFTPVADFERTGFIPGVVFPTGVVETKGTILVYYGASDTYTAVVEFSRAELCAMLAPVTPA